MRSSSDVAEPADAVDRLIALANEGGGPDNITCVVADLVDGSPVGRGRIPLRRRGRDVERVLTRLPIAVPVGPRA